jgi:colanic acid biosynthesis protein WcaH
MTDTGDDRWIPPEEWSVVVDNVPLVSVDLIVKHEDGVVLGLRENDPAKGEWFVPGGVVFKNERLTEAVDRVARTELGTGVEILDRLGTFEHFYETSEVEGVDSKHYVAHAFLVDPDGPIGEADDQHTDLRVFHPPFEDFHPYVQRYVDMVSWGEW